MKTDLIIIGAGPGGYETAIMAAKAGLKTILIESHELGGTCLNRGCIPTKSLCYDAKLISKLSKGSDFDINFDTPHTFNFQKAIKRKDLVVNTLRQGIESLLQHPNITLIQGQAQFVNSNSVRINNQSEIFEATNIILATGSTTKSLKIPGTHLPHVVSSTEIIQLNEVPQQLAIIGGGVIGLEFASIFNAFGSKVTILEYFKEILPNMDKDMAKRLRIALKDQGIDIQTGAQVTSIIENDNSYVVSYQHKDIKQFITSDIVLVAVGRSPNINSINLSEVGIAYDNNGIHTDKDFRTNLPHIFAIGDINGRCQLAHAATFQGKHVINTILGQKDKIRFDIMPSVVFTNPELASVGMTQDQCTEQKLNFKVHKSFYRSNGKALTIDQTQGLIKILSDEKDKIIGAHILGANASDLIHEVVIAMNQNCVVKDLTDCIHAHPSLSEIIMNASGN